MWGVLKITLASWKYIDLGAVIKTLFQDVFSRRYFMTLICIFKTLFQDVNVSWESVGCLDSALDNSAHVLKSKPSVLLEKPWFNTLFQDASSRRLFKTLVLIIKTLFQDVDVSWELEGCLDLHCPSHEKLKCVLKSKPSVLKTHHWRTGHQDACSRRLFKTLVQDVCANFQDAFSRRRCLLRTGRVSW